MVPEPIALWSAGPVQCTVVHHPEAHSYRVQIVVRGRVFTRRWFDRSEDAATFAAELAVQFGVEVPSEKLSAARAR